MKIWLINGYTKNIGLWEVDLFTDKESAKETFNYYLKEYNASVCSDNKYVATTSDGYGKFYLEEREI